MWNNHLKTKYHSNSICQNKITVISKIIHLLDLKFIKTSFIGQTLINFKEQKHVLH